MTPARSTEIRLASRPIGLPSAENFTLATIDLSPPKDGEVLVHNFYISVDPYMRGRMNEGKSYVPPFQLGKAMEGGAVGEVIESRSPLLKPGDTVASMYGWRDYFVTTADRLRSVDRHIQPLSVYLGTLGVTGLTAWAGLKLIHLKAGETIFISGAAGAVGNVAGQLAKLAGCHVIGSAGSHEKVKFLLEECGFDHAFNYHSAPLLDQLNLAAPDGIDVYFDNVGGPTLEAALSSLRVHGRIAACGSISGYNQLQPLPGPSNLSNIITRRLTIKGFIVSDWLNRQSEFETEAAAFLQAGKLKDKQTIFKGIENAVDAFLGLFDGRNTGKMVVELLETRSTTYRQLAPADA
jgi:NADPH-dependent curcumin reductase CurA